MARQSLNIMDPKIYRNVRGRTPIKEIECPTLFFDIVEFSKDSANEEMIEIVETMQDRIYKLLARQYYWAEKERFSQENNFILIPTGDGYGIVWNNIEQDDAAILDVASLLHQAFTRNARFRFRMGISRGRNLITLDLNGNVNAFGYGVVFATRVCNAAGPGQILVDSAFAELVLQRAQSVLLKPIGTEFETKHGEKFRCHNYAGVGFGIEV